MKARYGLPACLALVVSASALSAQDTTELKYKVAKKWTYVLPNETWTPMMGGITVDGSRFKTRKGGGLKLEIDANADGKYDTTIKGMDGFAVLDAKSEDGERTTYAVRLRNKDKEYGFASSGFYGGSVNGTKIALIDQNNNGVWNEIGVDAIVVGKRSKAASFLSRVINVDGELFEIDVKEDGTEITAKPWNGASGTLNLVKGLESRGRLDSVVVTSADGTYSFELSDARKGMAVPVGDYKLAAGRLSKGAETVRVAQGKMPGFEVTEGAELSPTWGGGVIMEFPFTHADGIVKVEPASLHFYGEAGEEYLDFLPQGKSPKFTVHDKETGRALESGRFGGC
jgi:hypothetical protein